MVYHTFGPAVHCMPGAPVTGSVGTMETYISYRTKFHKYSPVTQMI